MKVTLRKEGKDESKRNWVFKGEKARIRVRNVIQNIKKYRRDRKPWTAKK